MVCWPRAPAGASVWSRTGAWRLSPRPWRRWPQVLSALALVAGIVVIALGVTGLTATQHHVKHITEQLGDALKP